MRHKDEHRAMHARGPTYDNVVGLDEGAVGASRVLYEDLDDGMVPNVRSPDPSPRIAHPPGTPPDDPDCFLSPPLPPPISVKPARRLPHSKHEPSVECADQKLAVKILEKSIESAKNGQLAVATFMKQAV